MKATLVFLTILSLAFVAAGCNLSTDGDESLDPLTHPAFLTPVAEAREAGVEPYWLGAEFRAGTQRLKIVSVAGFRERWGPNVNLDYVSPDGGILSINTYATRSGAEEYRDAAVRGVPQPVQIGQWSGELFLHSPPNRPVNTIMIFLEMEQGTARITTAAVLNGVPGSDPNPLIDLELLTEVVAEHLRPLPE